MRSSLVGIFLVLLAGSPGCGGQSPSGADAAGGVDSGDGDAEPLFDAAPVPDAPPLGDGVRTLAGSDKPGDTDGPRNIARLHNPVNVAVGPSGDLFVADFDNNLLRRIAPDGYVTTLTPPTGFRRPFGLAFSTDGTLYVETDYDDQTGSDESSGTVWEVDTTSGAATVIARDIGRPRGLLVLPDGRLLLPDMIRHDVRVLDPSNGEITALAGLSGQSGFVDGTGTDARFAKPYDAVLDDDGTILLADMDNHAIRRVTLDGKVTTVAGTGAPGADDGPALSATFNGPKALARVDGGTLYVTDTGNYVLRAISTDGQVTTIAGDGVAGFADGEPMQARFFGLEGLDVSSDGSLLFVADGNRGTEEPYHRIRRVTLDP